MSLSYTMERNILGGWEISRCVHGDCRVSFDKVLVNDRPDVLDALAAALIAFRNIDGFERMGGDG